MEDRQNNPNTPRSASRNLRLVRFSDAVIRPRSRRPQVPPAQRFARMERLPPTTSPTRANAAIPGANRLREVLSEQLLSSRNLSRVPPRIRPSHDVAPPAQVRYLQRNRVSVSVRVVYGAIAASSIWLLLSALAPTTDLHAAQAANQITCAIVVMLCATAAALGLYRVRILRYACTLTGAWLMAAPFFLPGPVATASFFGGLAIFGAAGWASDAVELRA